MNFVLTHCPFCFKKNTIEFDSERFTQCLLNEDGHYFSACYSINDNWDIQHYIIKWNRIKIFWQRGEYTIVYFPPDNPGKILVGDIVLSLTSPPPSIKQMLNPKELIEKMKALVIFS